MRFAHPHDLRQAAREGSFASPTSGEAPGFVQANLVAVPEALAGELEGFVARNPKPCPLLEVVPPGAAPQSAPRSDLRTDLPRYRVFREGRPPLDTTDAAPYWDDGLVAFLLGCSFTFDHLLVDAGFEVRHTEMGLNAPMYITSVECEPCGPFRSPLVVSMRPFAPDLIESVKTLTKRAPLLHGAPIWAGNPDQIGIEDLDRPDFGDPVRIADTEIPVFWACGVTPQIAVERAELPLAITHVPGHMFVTDWRLESLLT